MMPDEDLETLRRLAARVPVLERNLHRQKSIAQELERLVENRTRDLYLAMENIKRQARLVGARTAIALLGEHGSLEGAAPQMLRSFGEELGWDAVHLWVYDPSRDSLTCRAQWSAPSLERSAFSSSSLAHEFLRGQGLPGRVLDTATTAWIAIDADTNFPRGELAKLESLQTGCAFPIIVDGEVHAVIEMFSKEQRARDEDLVVTFRALGSQIGQVIERERTRQELRAKELEIATRIQTAILPRDLLVEGLDIAAGMVPADEVGGDYYDVMKYPGGAWLAIGDVTGHGVGAGMIMIMLRSAVAALTRFGAAADLKSIVVALNALMYDTIRKRMRANDHVTFSLLQYSSDGTVRFAGAHEDILVWRSATGQIEEIPAVGAWLGAAASIESVTTESRFSLHPGDVLVLYTDGVIEARDGEKRQFGMHRLSELVSRHAPSSSPAALYSEVIKAVLDWGRQTDDISLIIGRKT